MNQLTAMFNSWAQFFNYTFSPLEVRRALVATGTCGGSGCNSNCQQVTVVAVIVTAVVAVAVAAAKVAAVAAVAVAAGHNMAEAPRPRGGGERLKCTGFRQRA